MLLRSTPISITCLFNQFDVPQDRDIYKKGGIILVGCCLLGIIGYPSDVSVGVLSAVVFSTSYLPKVKGGKGGKLWRFVN